MKIKIYLLIISFNLFGIGFDATEIYTYPNDLSLSGAGVASRDLFYNNPAISNREKSTISFSANRYTEYSSSGNSLFYSKGSFLFSLNSQKINDIEIRDDIPSDEPLDIIELPFLSFGLSKGFQINDNTNIGLGAHFYYSDLWIKKDTELTLNFGFKKIFLDNFQLGFMVKNFSSNNSEIPTNYISGISYLNSKYNTELLLDYNYSAGYHNGFHLGVIQKIKIITINLGYSSNTTDILRTTISSGLQIDINKNYKFLYSILSHLNTNLGLSHYFGIEISI